MIKMLNQNLLCEAHKVEGKNETGLILPTEKNYKVLKIVESNEELVPVGSIVYVPKTSGVEVEVEGKPFEIINVREVILICD